MFFLCLQVEFFMKTFASALASRSNRKTLFSPTSKETTSQARSCDRRSPKKPASNTELCAFGFRTDGANCARSHRRREENQKYRRKKKWELIQSNRWKWTPVVAPTSCRQECYNILTGVQRKEVVSALTDFSTLSLMHACAQTSFAKPFPYLFLPLSLRFFHSFASCLCLIFFLLPFKNISQLPDREGLQSLNLVSISTTTKWILVFTNILIFFKQQFWLCKLVRLPVKAASTLNI